MRLGILSDLHLEFMGDDWRSFVDRLPVACDTLVVAGDLTSSFGPSLHEVYRALCDRFGRVVAVLGNHEYYGSDPGSVHQETSHAVEVCGGRLTWLHRSVATIDSARFVGCSLWFPRSPGAPTWTLNDFSQIAEFSPWVYEENAVSTDWLRDTVRPGDVVVTHHLPSHRSVHPKYAGNAMNAFFVCDVESLIRARKPMLWIHGHTHESCDYAIASTRVMCNPYGFR